MDRYIHAGDRVLDIGGGPGRYAMHLAQKGCHVTLMDLSPANVEFAKVKAAENNMLLEALPADARFADKLIAGPFDVVLLMGPLYHLPEEKDRDIAVKAALNLLRPGGLLYATFISSYAPVWDYLARYPHLVAQECEQKFFALMEKDMGYSGFSFTQTHFIRPSDVRPFMAAFPLNTLHLLGSESILSLREQELSAQSPEVIKAWIDFAEKVCERDEFLGMAEHFLYIGKRL